MGLFDKFRKHRDSDKAKPEKSEESLEEKSAEAVESEAQTAQPQESEVKAVAAEENTDKALEPQAGEVAQAVSAESKAEDTTPQKKPEVNRFTYVVEETFPLTGKWGTIVVGDVHGKVTVGDELYILSPVGNTFTKARLDGIEVNDTPVKTAENQGASLRFGSMQGDKKIPKYSVISNIPPQQKLDINVAVENPFLLGFIAAYQKLRKSKSFLNILIFHVVHSYLLAPIHTDSEPVDRGDGRSGFKPGTKIRFLSVSNQSSQNTHAFPVFTHWGAVAKWKNVFDENHPPRTMILRFPECVDIISKTENNDGIVINPFGPVALHLPRTLIDGIINSPGYQKEFGNKGKEGVK